RFFAEISSPNGAEDEYAYNNTLETSFVLPSNYSDGVEIQFLTNSTSFFENSYTLTDDKGNVLYERGAQTLSANTIYSDDWELASGCYTLRFEDAGDDGISFWANNDGSGWVRLRDKDGNVIVAFEPDYGDDIIHHFTVGYDLGEEFFDQPCSFEAVAVEEELNNYFIDIYPNPTQGEAFVEVNFADSQDITLRIINTLGQTLEVLQYDNIQQDKIAVEMPAQIGLYFLQLETATGKVTHPIVVSD
ncbi:MAG: T9SS type A sorting domain-containing protein, partial [Chitinophagales bacterium]